MSTVVAQAAGHRLTPRTAVASAGGSSAGNVLDGNYATSWSAESFAPVWIQVDLGRAFPVSKVRLRANMFPNGYAVQKLYAGSEAGSLTLKQTVGRWTANGDWIEFAWPGSEKSMGTVRYIRVETVSSPSWVSWSEVEVYQGLEYVAYYGDEYDVTSAVAAGANVTMISGDATGFAYAQQHPEATATDVFAVIAADLNAKMEDAHNLGMKVIVASVFFRDDYRLRPDWRAVWDNVAATVNAADYPEDVIAFYLQDEPYWGGRQNGVTNDAMRDSLLAISSAMRDDFPETPQFITLGVPDLSEPLGYGYLWFVDWVGFDCYGVWSACQGAPMQTHIGTLRSWLSSTQQMVAIPWAWNHSDSGLVTGDTSDSTQRTLIDSMAQWQSEVLSDPKYVMIAPFIWDFPGDGAATIGARFMPDVAKRIYEFSATMDLAPSNRVYPIAASASGVAQQGAALAYPFKAYNDSVTDYWSAGTGAPAWISFDLGSVSRITRLEFVTNQWPSGPTTHYFQILSNGEWQNLFITSRPTVDGETFVWQGQADFRFLRINTTASPSWVSWREARFFE